MRKRKLYFNKKASILVWVLALGVSFIFAQEDPQDDTGKGTGLGVTINLYVDPFSLTSKTFEHPEIRGTSAQDYTVAQYFFANKDFWSDSEAVLEYNGKRFGGKFGIKPGTDLKDLSSKLKGWVQFGFLRVTMGNDIESTYADSLDADPAIRIYTGTSWNSTVNPDNITRDEGVLVEAFLKPFTLAAAAGNFLSNVNFTSYIPGTNDYKARYDVSFRYGARVGYELGSLGKLNASYTMEEKTVADKYGFKTDSTEAVAKEADAQVFDHIFGLYGSFHLTPVIDLTVGYNGGVTAYLPEYYSAATRDMVDTGYPTVFKNGFNVNARYRADGLTLRTDHCFTFWNDKNYQLLEANDTAWVNVGLQPTARADNYAAISHLILWNGFGAAYDFTNQITGSVYARNLFSQYAASGTTPTGEGNYSIIRDQIGVEFKLVYKIHAKAEVFVKVVVEDTITMRSRDLNDQTSGHFIDHINNIAANPKPEAVATLDNELKLRIPIGITLKLQ